MAEYSRFWTGEVLGDAGPYTFGDQWEIDRAINIDSDEIDERGPIAGNLEELQVVVDAPPSMNVVVEPGAALCYGGWYFNTVDVLLPPLSNGIESPPPVPAMAALAPLFSVMISPPSGEAHIVCQLVATFPLLIWRIR